MQRHIAYVLPIAVATLVTAHAWVANFSRNTLYSGGALGVVAIALGLALHRRSQGKEAKFGTARAEHDPDETPDDSVDVASLDALFVLCALLMILVAALLPALK